MVVRGDVIIEQSAPGEECRLFIPDPAADDTQVDERVRDRLNVLDAGIGLGLDRIHRIPALDQVAQETPLEAFADVRSQTAHEWLPLAPAGRDGVITVFTIVEIVEKQLRQVGVVSRPRGQGGIRIFADQLSRLPVKQD